MSGGGRDLRSVAAKLFAVADALDNGQALSLSAIARAADIPVSTAHRLLAEWVAWGRIVLGSDGLYRASSRKVSRRQAPPRSLIIRAALPYVHDLLEVADDVQLTGHGDLTILRGRIIRRGNMPAGAPHYSVSAAAPLVLPKGELVIGSIAATVALAPHAEASLTLGVRLAARGISAVLA